MSYVSEHDYPRDDVHAAFGDQVADLPIGPSPTTAVMKDGKALRTRRRLTLGSGVAALAVLPVAAVALFAPGDGTAVSPAAGYQTPDPEHLDKLQPLPSPTTAAPQTDDRAAPVAPDSADEIKVLASGTIDGQHWRFIRDRYVVSASDTANSAWGGVGVTHYPVSERTRPNTYFCEYVGVQWGDRPPGTTPDFGLSGHCSSDGTAIAGPSTTPVGLLSSNLPQVRPGAVTTVSATVDSSKVASATIAVAGRISEREPVITVPGEHTGYVFFLVDPSYDAAGAPMLLTVYDAHGKAIESDPLEASKKPAH